VFDQAILFLREDMLMFLFLLLERH